MAAMGAGHAVRITRAAIALLLGCGAAALAVTGTSGAATRAPAAAITKTLVAKVAAGTLGTVGWTVPSVNEFEMSSFAIASTVAGTAGQLRIQTLKPGANNPQNLLDVDLAQVQTKAFKAALATPAVLTPAERLLLNVSCQPNSKKVACRVTLTFSGQLVAKSTHTSAFASNLEDVVAPGTLSTTKWTVPAGDSFALTDLVLSEAYSTAGTGGTQNGTVSVIESTPAGKRTTLLNYSVATLGRLPIEARYKAPLTLPARDSLSLTVKCDSNQPACAATLLFSGKLT